MSRSRRTLPALLLSLLAACSGGGSPAPSAAPSIPGVVFTTGLSHQHVAHAVAYPTHPPVGGPHWPPQALSALGWQACAVYAEPVVDEFAVHSLEHGAVWITYLPAVAKSEVDQLVQLRSIRPAYVLVSPYPGQKSPVMATAWGGQLGVTSASDVRLAEFVRQYAGGGQGGELGADCAHGSTLAQARAALARSATG